MKNIIVGQSGGPTAVINSSLYGVITSAFASEEINTVYGMLNGVEGFCKDKVMDLSTIPEEDLLALRTTPGAYLGSCRYKLPENLDDEFYPNIFRQFENYEISAFFYIGGNDSMDTASKLSRYARKINSDICFIGIPKTIDNDLTLTDHTPGYGSAAKFVASMVKEISRDTAVYDRKTVTIIEIMGRNAGWLTAASALARQTKDDNPLLIYLPETDFNEEDFLVSVSDLLNKRNNITVCVSEGIHEADGTFICEKTVTDDASGTLTDTFGHRIMNGCGKYLENLVRNRLGIKSRSVELNVAQRCASAYLSKTDMEEAENAGKFAVTSAMAGKSGYMAACFRKEQENYEVGYGLVDVNEVCNKEKCVPLHWITDNNTDVSQEFIDYAMPLIQGSVEIPEINGLPYFAYRK